MGRHRLTNDEWGFESNCYVCEPRNARGLRLAFFHDDDEQAVVCEFALDETYSGAPNFVHGGLTLAILDEAQAWACIALARKFAVTTQTTTTFLRPIMVGRRYVAEARVEDVTDEAITTSARMLDTDKGKVRAESRATFLVLSDAVAKVAIGEGAEQHAEYLRDGQAPQR